MLRIIDEVPEWLPGFNFLAQLAQAPKRHLVDPALAVRALGLNAEMLLNGEQGVLKLEDQGNLLGRLFESLVTLSIKVFAQTHGATISHLRSRRGEHEVDLILETEVIDLIVITTGDATFRRPDGVAVIPSALLGM